MMFDVVVSLYYKKEKLMSEDKYIRYTAEDFILDDNFMRWVLHPERESDRFWSHFMELHPEKRDDINEAHFLIHGLQVVEPSLLSERMAEIRSKVLADSGPSNSPLRNLIGIAAAFLLVISLGGLIYFLLDSRQSFPVDPEECADLNKGMVILPDGTTNEFDTEQTRISQTTNGNLTINNDTVSITQHACNQGNSMARVIVPYGKRSEITLSDGTRIWLNAGSQLSYPLSFLDDKREVYLSGEAFFDVESDAVKPFHVITEDMKIRVTGTRFNVTSYGNDRTTQAVLLSGNIDAAKNRRFAQSMALKPGERIVYDRNEGNLEVESVDVELYASWVKGYLIFENEPVEHIIRKLERYYDKNILTEKLSGQPAFTGKLDLADNLERVLENIAFSASFSVDYQDGNYIIKPKT